MQNLGKVSSMSGDFPSILSIGVLIDWAQIKFTKFLK